MQHCTFQLLWQLQCASAFSWREELLLCQLLEVCHVMLWTKLWLLLVIFFLISGGELEYQMFLYRLTKHSWHFRFINCYLNLLTCVSPYQHRCPPGFSSFGFPYNCDLLSQLCFIYDFSSSHIWTCSIRYCAYYSIVLSVWLMDKYRNNCLLQPQHFLDVAVLNWMI